MWGGVGSAGRTVGWWFHPKITRLEKPEESHVSVCHRHVQTREGALSWVLFCTSRAFSGQHEFTVGENHG